MTTCFLSERVVFMLKLVMMTLIMVMVVVATVLMTKGPMAHPLILQTLPGTLAIVHHLLYHLVCAYSFFGLDSDIPQAALIAQVFLSSVLPYLACELNYNYLLLMEFITPRGSKNIHNARAALQ